MPAPHWCFSSRCAEQSDIITQSACAEITSATTRPAREGVVTFDFRAAAGPLGLRRPPAVHDVGPAAAAVGARGREVRRGRAAVVGLVALLDQVAVEVVGGLDDVARILDEGRRGAVVRHELREALALVVDVHDVRPAWTSNRSMAWRCTEVFRNLSG